MIQENARSVASMQPFVLLSYGVGVNSTSVIAGLVERKEPPDAILFSDTGGEKPKTYEYLRMMQTYLKDNGFPPVTVVKQKLTLEADCLERETLPGKAFGFGSCSDRFKIQPQKKWLRDNNIVNPMWLVGIHSGEKHRAERTLNQRTDVRFPLIEWGWDQDDCIKAIERAGLPIPIKSACFYCPSMRKQEVLALAKSDPELFQRAVEMERAAKEAGTLKTVKGLGRRWSWESLVKADESQLRLPLFDDVQAPICDQCVDW
jgi:3'-phosphoadenosine 5'-phosphosulfate sulfotransferase (PAPS reductase)/FAD synthetase